MKSKRGITLTQAGPAVLMLILIAILVIISIYLVVSIQGTFTDLATVTVTNETGWINSTTYTISNATRCNFEDAAITQALNATSGAVINSGNYSINSATGVVTNASTTAWNSVLLSYTYNWGSEACDASSTTITQFASYPALVGLVGTIIFLALVIGVLVTSFVMNPRRI